MARKSPTYLCSRCGESTSKWAGQCPACGEWNSLAVFHGAAAAPARAARGAALPQRLGELPAGEAPRVPTGLAEFDRVLGGGLVAGSAILIGGDPGIGKSTLLLQCAAALSARCPVLYATGEESLAQVGLRAKRLGLGAAPLALLASTEPEAVIEAARALKARLLVVDSIQTLADPGLDSGAGSVAQLKACAARLIAFAKDGDCALCLIGHVTKEGVIAGPRVLEHLVDTVLYFETDLGSRFRLVRAVKNRFGAANEMGVFAMTESGLKEVKNPSAIFLARAAEPAPGSIVLVTREGTRALLVELQALVDESRLAMPRRLAVGIDANRLALLLAVLNRHGGVALGAHDVFVNVVGGVRVEETAADLAVLLACTSSIEGRPLPAALVAFGELGLSGEIRPVPYGEERLREAAKHGFTRAIVPEANLPRQAIPGLTVLGVSSLAQALAALR
jgi:DNA repair protein RadA/Sms